MKTLTKIGVVGGLVAALGCGSGAAKSNEGFCIVDGWLPDTQCVELQNTADSSLRLVCAGKYYFSDPQYESLHGNPPSAYSVCSSDMDPRTRQLKNRHCVHSIPVCPEGQFTGGN